MELFFFGLKVDTKHAPWEVKADKGPATTIVGTLSAPLFGRLPPCGAALTDRAHSRSPTGTPMPGPVTDSGPVLPRMAALSSWYL